jgi:ABC-type proline/glycine betaine transport system permease subunit
MCFVYVGLGIFLLFAVKVLNFSTIQKNGVGIILIAYGLFRFYNAYKKRQEEQEEENDE